MVDFAKLMQANKEAQVERAPFELDIENLVDFFQIKLRDERTSPPTIHNFATWPDGPPLDLQALCNLLSRITIYTFNGIGYDLPILTLALHGASHQQLKAAGDAIIVGGLQWWNFYKSYGIEVPSHIDHVDLQQVAPGVRISLKMLMGRMHAPTMQDLPVCPNTPLPAHMRLGVSTYCDNDLHGTSMLRHEVSKRLALRIAIGKQYGVDVRSKSDAQIAEVVIKSQLGFDPNRRYVPDGFSFNYTPPTYIRFVSPVLQELLNICATAPFLVRDKEEAEALGFEDVKTGVKIPTVLKGRDIVVPFGKTVYRMGIGGLHSQEKCVNYVSDDQYVLWDIDVRSYYPSLILNMGLVPEQLGPAFLIIYRAIIEKRLLSKSEAARLFSLGAGLGGVEGEEMIRLSEELQTESDGLKIVGNGTFGKLFSKYSFLFAPELGIAVTMTGQLSLLMLIEMMELSGIQCVSANTDGIVLRIPVGKEWLVRSNVKWWEQQTGLKMEETHYAALYSRDVNNYIAITVEDKVKRKGVFNQGGVLSGPQGKSPDKDICADAVVEFLQRGTPIEVTIAKCNDIRKFVQIRNVKGGGFLVRPSNADGTCPPPVHLGKAVRWYYGMQKGYIAYKSNGNQVAGSKNATPVMQLPDQLPEDINYQHYIDVADDMLRDVGIEPDYTYWYHAESNSCFSTRKFDSTPTDQGCDQLTYKEYCKKR